MMKRNLSFALFLVLFLSCSQKEINIKDAAYENIEYAAFGTIISIAKANPSNHPRGNVQELSMEISRTCLGKSAEAVTLQVLLPAWDDPLGRVAGGELVPDYFVPGSILFIASQFAIEECDLSVNLADYHRGPNGVPDRNEWCAVVPYDQIWRATDAVEQVAILCSN